MRRAAKNALAFLLAVLMVFPGAGALAVGEGQWEVPPDDEYEFENNLIKGLKLKYLNGLTGTQQQNLLLRIPAEIGGGQVTGIADNAFNPEYYKNNGKPADCVYALDFSDAKHLKSIGTQSFFKCGFQGELVLPESIESVGKNAFNLYSGGKPGFTGELRLPASLETIGTAAFSYQEGITSVIFPEDCKLTELINTFRYCTGLTGVLRLPDSIQTLKSADGGSASTFEGTGLETVYLPKGIAVGSNCFQNCNRLTAVVCADEADYTALKNSLSSTAKSKLAYPVEITLDDGEGGDYAPLERLYNQPLNLTVQEDGGWRVDPSFTLPELSGAPEGYVQKWSFSTDNLTGVSEASLVAGPNLYAVNAYAPPVITYSDGIDKEYDGLPSIVSVTASHPFYKPASQAGENDVVFYYWWYWNTIGGSPAALSGYDKSAYDVGGVRAPFAISCYVVVRAYIVDEKGHPTQFYEDRHEFAVDLRKGTPKVDPQYPTEPFAYQDSTLPALTAGPNAPAGEISWDAGQSLELGGGAYRWTFTPSDTDNYRPVNGAAYLYAYDASEAETPPAAAEVVESLLPELPDADPTAQQQADILGAKILAETAGGELPQETRDTLHEALSKLPQVGIQVEGVAVEDQTALLENMTAEQAQALLSASDGDADYQIIISAQTRDPMEDELTAVNAALGGAKAVQGRAVTVKEVLKSGGQVVERELDVLQKPVQLVFSVPESSVSSSRTFFAVRTHAAAGGGVDAERLPDEDTNPATVTVTSRLFSYYTLAYEEDLGNGGGSHGGGGSSHGSASKPPAPQPAEALTDIAGHWAEAEIRTVVNAGIFHGVTEDLFDPEGAVTRGMFVTGLYRLSGEPAARGPAAFSDIPADSWYADAVTWAGAEKVVNGYTDGSFSPNTAVTREQLAAFFCRDAARRGLGMETMTDLSVFQDGDQVSRWARDAVSWCVSRGLLTGRGDGTLDPVSTASRAEVAVLFSRYMALGASQEG